MKHMKFLLPMMGCIAAIGVMIGLVSGCEDEPSTEIEAIDAYQTDTADFENIDDQVSAGFGISPQDKIVISSFFEQQGEIPDLAGDTIVYSTVGGEAPYSWSSSDSDIATISQSGVATLTGDAVGTTTISARDARNRLATTALKVQFNDAALPSLSITPTEMTFTSSSTTDPSDLAGASVTFTAIGGRPPYSFTGESDLGDLVVTSSDSASFRVSGDFTGSMTVTVIDSADQFASAQVIVALTVASTNAP